jgi:asparagine synthase (glutamine-hydrolysing)
VLPGERIQHDQGRVIRTFYWNAVALAQADDSISAPEAQVLTHRVVRSCVHAWASCFESISLQLSGGLDSTIVASCLSDAPTRPKIVGLNFHSQFETSDERLFAREVAARCGFELVEVRAEGNDELDLTQRDTGAVIPTPIASSLATWRIAQEALASWNVGAHFRGDGGDELFYRGGVLPDAVDLAYRQGLTPRIWSVALNDAVIARTSIWEVLHQTAKYGLMKRSYNWKQPDWLPLRTMFLTHDVREKARRDDTNWHPLYRGSVNCPPAKLSQAFTLLEYTNMFFIETLNPNQPRMVSPLIAQPHMELALRTPLHVLRAGGRDRAMARAAFENAIPSAIAHRKYKGLSNPRVSDWIAGDTTVRELMLDGYLVRERIIDRHTLETFLAKVPSHQASASPHIMLILSTEAWIRNSRMRGSQAA